MRFLESILLRGGFLAAVLAVLAACTVVVEDPAPIDPGPGPRICTREYQPVCARRDGERRTFPNECLAETSGYRVIRDGECRRVDDESPRVCTRVYDPVCAVGRGERRTFGNTCEAEVAGYRVIASGECRGGREPGFCTREYAPVCGKRGGSIRTFGNECEADAEGYRVIADGPC